MKKSIKKFLSLVLALVILLSVSSVAFAAQYKISNPYEKVNWNKVNTYKTALHSHTNASDGDQTLAQSIERHARTGFDIVAITDHGTTDYGWTKNNSNEIHTLLKIGKRTEGDIVPIEPNGSFSKKMTYAYRTAKNGDDYLKINNKKYILRLPFGIENNAVSVNAHVNSWFVDFHNNSVTTYKDAIAGVDRLGGVSVINHPGEYTKARYEIRSEKAYNENNFAYRYYINKFSSLLENYPSCIGIDINSKGDSRTRFDRILWDKLLTRFSKNGRSVYAIASSDAHQLDKINTGYTLLLMPTLNSKSAKKALENGEFFAASHCIGNYDELLQIRSALKKFYGKKDKTYRAVTAACIQMKNRIEGIESGKYKAKASIDSVYSVLDKNGFLAAKTEPRIKKIAVNRKTDTIAIKSSNALIVRLISDGKLIDTKKPSEAIFNLAKYKGKLGNYVRFEVFGEGGIVYTQAFLLNADKNSGGNSAVDKGFFDVGFFDFLFAEINRWVSVVGRKFGK